MRGGYGMVKALLLLYVLWGFNWVVMKEANLFFPPIAFSCYRFLLGAAVLLAFTGRGLLLQVFCRLPSIMRLFKSACSH